MLWCLSILLISKNSLLKPALPEESIAMSFRRDETGLPATREGAIERPKYRAVERFLATFGDVGRGLGYLVHLYGETRTANHERRPYVPASTTPAD